MILKPTSVGQLSQQLASLKAEKIKAVDLTALNRILEYTPEDMTVTVEAGITLAVLQAELASHRQWLPLDPPHPDRLTISALINTDPSGPCRFGYGTIRDHLIGIKVALADGTVICSGGKVVKNVAGYDLAKLFIGGYGSLGIVVECTFKLRPLPELERFTQMRCSSLEQADNLIEAVIKSEATPIVLDLHGSAAAATLTVGFAGSREEVEWQLARSAELRIKEEATLDYETKFWADTQSAHRVSVLPSKLIEAIRGLNGAPFVARAGNGVIYHRGAETPRRNELPLELMRRLKDTYDPRHVLPALPL